MKGIYKSKKTNKVYVLQESYWSKPGDCLAHVLDAGSNDRVTVSDTKLKKGFIQQ